MKIQITAVRRPNQTNVDVGEGVVLQDGHLVKTLRGMKEIGEAITEAIADLSTKQFILTIDTPDDK